MAFQIFLSTITFASNILSAFYPLQFSAEHNLHKAYKICSKHVDMLLSTPLPMPLYRKYQK